MDGLEPGGLDVRTESRRQISDPWGRALGSNWSRSMQSCSRSRGTFFAIELGAGASWYRFAIMTAIAAPSNGRRPVRHR